MTVRYFFDAVVVDRHRAAAEVDVLAHVAVAHVGQMRDLGAVADGGVLDLRRSRPRAPRFRRCCTGADIRKGADVRVVADGGIIDLRGVDLRAVADACVLQTACSGRLCSFCRSRSAPRRIGSGQQRRPRSDGSRRVRHSSRVVVPDLDALLRKARTAVARERTGCQLVISCRSATPYTPSRSVYGTPLSFKNAVKMNFSSSAAISACLETEVTGLTIGAPSNCSSSAANGRITAGPVTTMMSSSDSSAVDKNTCSWSLVASTDGQLNCHIVREACARLTLEPLVADQKEPPNAAGNQRGRQPG